jgi:hypothetical protein
MQMENHAPAMLLVLKPLRPILHGNVMLQVTGDSVSASPGRIITSSVPKKAITRATTGKTIAA